MNILHIIMILIHLNLNIILEVSYNNMHMNVMLIFTSNMAISVYKTIHYSLALRRFTH